MNALVGAVYLIMFLGLSGLVFGAMMVGVLKIAERMK